MKKVLLFSLVITSFLFVLVACDKNDVIVIDTASQEKQQEVERDENSISLDDMVRSREAQDYWGNSQENEGPSQDETVMEDICKVSPKEMERNFYEPILLEMAEYFKNEDYAAISNNFGDYYKDNNPGITDLAYHMRDKGLSRYILLTEENFGIGFYFIYYEGAVYNALYYGGYTENGLRNGTGTLVWTMDAGMGREMDNLHNKYLDLWCVESENWVNDSVNGTAAFYKDYGGANSGDELYICEYRNDLEDGNGVVRVYNTRYTDNSIAPEYLESKYSSTKGTRNPLREDKDNEQKNYLIDYYYSKLPANADRYLYALDYYIENNTYQYTAWSVDGGVIFTIPQVYYYLKETYTMTDTKGATLKDYDNKMVTLVNYIVDNNYNDLQKELDKNWAKELTSLLINNELDNYVVTLDDNRYIAAYRINDVDCAFYYGEMQNNVRSGKGSMFYLSDEGLIILDSNCWQSDYAQGEAVIKKIYESSNYIVYKGNLHKGVFDGKVEATYHHNGKEAHTTIDFVKGYTTPIDLYDDPARYKDCIKNGIDKKYDDLGMAIGERLVAFFAFDNMSAWNYSDADTTFFVADLACRVNELNDSYPIRGIWYVTDSNNNLVKIIRLFEDNRYVMGSNGEAYEALQGQYSFDGQVLILDELTYRVQAVSLNQMTLIDELGRQYIAVNIINKR